MIPIVPSQRRRGCEGRSSFCEENWSRPERERPKKDGEERTMKEDFVKKQLFGAEKKRRRRQGDARRKREYVRARKMREDNAKKLQDDGVEKDFASLAVHRSDAIRICLSAGG
mmetsp:Transcript_24298/g.52958  ORF Transcript_24298/g.52958 Transcript_24298/m.52958 type:complete len:113 (-) Transcript_24298:3076-3414(-)